MAGTTMSSNDSLLLEIERRCLEAIQKRLQEELRPKMEKIYAEECAKMAIDLATMMSFERMGQDLRIVIHRVVEGKQS